MFVVDLYNGIYKSLANNETILELLGIVGGNNLTKAKRIQKRSKPQNLTENIPLISFYTPGSGLDTSNNNVYTSTFVFDVYTKDDVEKAHRIANTIYDIFNNKIPEFSNIGTFNTVFEDAHESATDLSNTYCFTIILTFSISLDD